MSPLRLLLAAALLLAPSLAAAQTDAFVSFGIGGRVFEPRDGGLDGMSGLSPLVRIRRGEGWKPDIRLDWYSVETSDGTRVRLRPLMVGLTRAWERRRVSLSISAAAGYAFCSAANDARPDSVYDASDSFAAASAVSLHYDLSARFGVRTSVGYVVVRPELTEGGRPLGRLEADSVIMKVGLTYGVF